MPPKYLYLRGELVSDETFISALIQHQFPNDDYAGSEKVIINEFSSTDKFKQYSLNQIISRYCITNHNLNNAPLAGQAPLAGWGFMDKIYCSLKDSGVYGCQDFFDSDNLTKFQALLIERGFVIVTTIKLEHLKKYYRDVPHSTPTKGTLKPSVLSYLSNLSVGLSSGDIINTIIIAKKPPSSINRIWIMGDGYYFKNALPLKDKGKVFSFPNSKVFCSLNVKTLPLGEGKLLRDLFYKVFKNSIPDSRDSHNFSTNRKFLRDTQNPYFNREYYDLLERIEKLEDGDENFVSSALSFYNEYETPPPAGRGGQILLNSDLIKNKIYEGLRDSNIGQTEISGFFHYPPGTCMRWHTNRYDIHEQCDCERGHLKWRIYLIWSEGDSGFSFIHPHTKQYKKIKDLPECVNIFKINSAEDQQYFWHSIYCNTENRYSMGVAVEDKTIKELYPLLEQYGTLI